MIKSFRFYIISFLVVIGLTLIANPIYKSFKFKRHIKGKLEQVVNSNTIDRASKELHVVLEYLEINNMTSGSTELIYFTPDNDVEFWYGNLKDSHNELLKLNSESTLLETSNVLMKLRESLTNSKGEIQYPPYLFLHPNIWLNISLCVVGVLCLIIGFAIIED